MPQIWTGAGYEDVPTYNISDFKQNPLETYTDYGWGDYATPEQKTRGGDWSLTPEAQAKYGDLWGGRNPTNFGFQQWGDDGAGGFTGLKGRLKSADKEGTNIEWVRQGDQFVPRVTGTEVWDTNPDHTKAALAFASLGGLGMAGNALLAGGALSGAGSGAAAGGMAAGEGAMIGPGMGAALPGSGGVTLSQGLNLAKTGLQGLSGAQKIAGAFGLGGAGGAGGGSQSRTNMQASAPRNWIDQLTGVGAGVYSDVQNREAFTNLNDLFSRREQARAPFEQALTESYANPNAYLNSPEYQALAAVRGNQLNRGAAQKGRLANDADREVLMQQHAQKGLADYRQGLTSALGQQQLPYEIFRDAQGRNARAGGATAGGINFSGMSGGLDDIIKGATGFGGTISDIFQGFGGYNPADMGPPDLGGVGDLGGFDNIDMSQWSMPDFDWSSVDWSEWF